jgi:hypothetical protein
MGRIKCNLCFKKKQAKKLLFASEIALRVLRSDPAQNPYVPACFRTQIHKKKFSKNGFHTLQGTMSHRPLTNASSLKIAAAYRTAIQSPNF